MNRIQVSLREFQIERLLPGKYALCLPFDPSPVSPSQHSYIPVNVIKGTADGPVLLVLAGVHGDEYEGVQTVLQLTQMLEAEHLRGTLMLVPAANMDAYAGGTRASQADGGNLARAFPGKPDGTHTERLAWHLNSALIDSCHFLLDLHSGGTYYAMPPMAGYDSGREEAARASRRAAECFGMPVIWGHGAIGPGRTISAAAEKGIPWLYTEGFGGRRVRPEEQKLYLEGAFRLMRHLDMLRNPQRFIRSDAAPIRFRLSGDGNLDHAAAAEQDGFFIPDAALLDEVKEGDRIGRIVDDAGRNLQIIHAAGDGVVVMLRALPPVKAGDGLYTLACKEM